ncbi:hypothetical protein [Ottowia thiooxydans]|uniref:hypothetical protein n=1 Tax=Ottowia thiooxydans TaxID=219182 RepID=UPI0004271989|nr:hypothetical protein [Ottowia thiooxydans]
MIGDISAKHSFLGNLNNQDLANVRIAADKGLDRLGIFERIFDRVSDWVFHTDRMQCKQCLLTFCSQKSTGVEKFAAFIRLQELTKPTYKDRFNFDSKDPDNIKLSIDVDLPFFNHLSFTASRDSLLAEQISKWSPQLNLEELTSLLSELYSSTTTVAEKYFAFSELKSNIGDEFASAFSEDIFPDGKQYAFGIDFGLEYFDNFLCLGDTFQPIEMGSFQGFTDSMIEIANAPLTKGAEHQFKIDIQRQTIYVNEIKFELILGENSDDTVKRFDALLVSEGFTVDEISMAKKFFHQSTMREFFRRAIDGFNINAIPGSRPEISHSISNMNGGFETKSHVKFTPLANKSILDRASIIASHRDFIPQGSIAEAEESIPTNDLHYKGWPSITKKREIISSDDSECSITMKLRTPDAKPEIQIDAKLGQYVGPGNYPRGANPTGFFERA